MLAEDVTLMLDPALQTAIAPGRAYLRSGPRLLSDNGSSYIAADLGRWLDDQSILLHACDFTNPIT